MIRTKNILSYFVIGTLISTVIFWDKEKSATEQSKLTSNNVVEIYEAKLKRIKFQNTAPSNNYKAANGTKIELVFDPQSSKWSIDQPIQEAADQGQVARIINSSANLIYDKKFESSTLEWHKFGLNKPRRIIQFYDSKNNSTSILVGDNTKVGNQAYIGNSAKQIVFTVAQTFLLDSDMSLFDFREKNIADINYEQVDYFEFESSTPLKFSINKVNGVFNFVDKRHKQLDQEFFGTFLAKLNLLTAQDFSLDSRTIQNFDKSLARYKIKFTTKNQATKIECAIVDEKIWARINDQKELRQLKQIDKEIFRVELIELQDKKILGLDDINISSIELDNKRLTTSKKESTKDFVDQLKSLEALSFIDNASVDLKLDELEPLHKIKLYQQLDDSKPTSELRVWSLGGKNILKNNTSNETYEISSSFTKSIAKFKKLML